MSNIKLLLTEEQVDLINISLAAQIHGKAVAQALGLSDLPSVEGMGELLDIIQAQTEQQQQPTQAGNN